MRFLNRGAEHVHRQWKCLDGCLQGVRPSCRCAKLTTGHDKYVLVRLKSIWELEYGCGAERASAFCVKAKLPRLRVRLRCFGIEV